MMPHINDIAPMDETLWYRVYWLRVGIGLGVGLLVVLGVMLKYLVVRPIVRALEGRRFILVLAFLTISSAAAAQPTFERVVVNGQECEVTRPKKHDTRVKCDDVEVGLEDTPDGTRYEMKKTRGGKGLGLIKTWKRKKVERVFENEKDPLPPPPGAEPAPPPMDAPASTLFDPVIIDYAVVWSQQVETYLGGQTQAIAHAVLMVAVANEVYANSGSPNIKLRLVGTRKVSYVESDAANPLSWGYNSLNQTNGEIKILRDATGADLVMFLTRNNACGQAYRPAGPQTAIGQSEIGCSVSNLSAVHETGHNQNMQHDPMTSCGKPACSGDNYGFGLGASVGRTVMAYPAAGGPRLRYFSNPDITYQGIATGLAGVANNAKQLRDTALAISQFRATVVVGNPPTTVTRQRIVH